MSYIMSYLLVYINVFIVYILYVWNEHIMIKCYIIKLFILYSCNCQYNILKYNKFYLYDT